MTRKRGAIARLLPATSPSGIKNEDVGFVCLEFREAPNWNLRDMPE